MLKSRTCWSTRKKTFWVIQSFFCKANSRKKVGRRRLKCFSFQGTTTSSSLCWSTKNGNNMFSFLNWYYTPNTVLKKHQKSLIGKWTNYEPCGLRWFDIETKNTLIIQEKTPSILQVSFRIFWARNFKNDFET